MDKTRDTRHPLLPYPPHHDITHQISATAYRSRVLGDQLHLGAGVGVNALVGDDIPVQQLVLAAVLAHQPRAEAVVVPHELSVGDAHAGGADRVGDPHRRPCVHVAVLVHGEAHELALAVPEGDAGGRVVVVGVASVRAVATHDWDHRGDT